MNTNFHAMIEKNKYIHLDGIEALEIIKKLDQFVVSLDKIKSYHAEFEGF